MTQYFKNTCVDTLYFRVLAYQTALSRGKESGMLTSAYLDSFVPLPAATIDAAAVIN